MFNAGNWSWRDDDSAISESIRTKIFNDVTSALKYFRKKAKHQASLVLFLYSYMYIRVVLQSVGEDVTSCYSYM